MEDIILLMPTGAAAATAAAEKPAVPAIGHKASTRSAGVTRVVPMAELGGSLAWDENGNPSRSAAISLAVKCTFIQYEQGSPTRTEVAQIRRRREAGLKRRPSAP